MNESGSALAESRANVGMGLGLMKGPHEHSRHARDRGLPRRDASALDRNMRQ